MTTPHEPAETPTPRTKAAIMVYANEGFPDRILIEYVKPEVCEQLERENEELRKALDVLRFHSSGCFCLNPPSYPHSAMCREVTTILARANRQGGAQG